VNRVIIGSVAPLTGAVERPAWGRRWDLSTQFGDQPAVRGIREARQLVYSIGASSEPAVIYPGFGLFAAVAPTDPVKAPVLAAAVEEMYAELAKAGPTADELAVAKRQMANLLDEILKDPSFWSSRLAALDYRGQKIDDVLGARAGYEAFTADEVRDGFARYDRPEARLRFIITPK